MRMIVIMMVAGLVLSGHHMEAQTRFGIDYRSELQTDFSGGVNFPNLLRMDASHSFGKTVSFEASSISIARTSPGRLIDDLQTFSNIEEENQPFALAVFGIDVCPVAGHDVFLGVRNVNEDFFISPVTSLFTNSSCGIFPTISCNFPIANYPLSSLGLIYSFQSEALNLRAAIYDGRGYASCDVFRFDPVSDGVFAMGELSLDRLGGSYHAGACVHSGGRFMDAGGTAWLYAEQPVTDGLSLIVDYSHAFGQSVACTDFAGLGLSYEFGPARLGLFTDLAVFRDNFEWAAELTCHVSINECLGIQPALHLIRQSDASFAAGMVRILVSLPNIAIFAPWKRRNR